MISALLFILAALVGLLWLLVWLVGHLPAFGIVDLRLALRNMTARRTRTATTLLALSAGMFALSSISFFGLGARQIVQFQICRDARRQCHGRALDPLPVRAGLC